MTFDFNTWMILCAVGAVGMVTALLAWWKAGEKSKGKK